MQILLGEDFPAFAQVYEERHVNGLRVNSLKISPTDFHGISPYPLKPIPWCPTGFILETPRNDQALSTLPPGKHPYHAAGLYYLQDPTAMAVAELLSPQPGELVLDLSAAPGGKSTHLVDLMRNQGILIANEIVTQRAWDLAENLERWGARITAILNARPEVLASQFGAIMDRVLLDAPCSGEGMFRKSENARLDWSIELIQSCALRQEKILTCAAQLVRPGGFLAYTTCTFTPEENERVIDRFLTAHPEFSLVNIPPQPGFTPACPDWVTTPSHHPLQRAVRLWPHMLEGEGHFIALLRKSTSSRAEDMPITRFKPQLPDKERLKLFYSFWENTFQEPPPTYANLHLSGTYLYQVQERLPDLSGLKIIHPGWWVGVFHRGWFEPAHALAMGIQPGQVQRVVNLSLHEPETLAYLRGESIMSAGEPGWCLVAVDNFPLGWGKRSHEMLKNAYPRGLRMFT
jgi:16S rRNA C967 or C1407 C5-methylase (RsmB/RsmF family)/NOL1/NOP2/fmu family ribosome biogenesis protein